MSNKVVPVTGSAKSLGKTLKKARRYRAQLEEAKERVQVLVDEAREPEPVLPPAPTERTAPPSVFYIVGEADEQMARSIRRYLFEWFEALKDARLRNEPAEITLSPVPLPAMYREIERPHSRYIHTCKADIFWPGLDRRMEVLIGLRVEALSVDWGAFLMQEGEGMEEWRNRTFVGRGESPPVPNMITQEATEAPPDEDHSKEEEGVAP